MIEEVRDKKYYADEIWKVVKVQKNKTNLSLIKNIRYTTLINNFKLSLWRKIFIKL